MSIESSEKIPQPVRKPYIAQDLDYINSVNGTPPQNIKDNPGKTIAELMSDEEISNYINDTKSQIDNAEECLKNSPDERQEFVSKRIKELLEPEFKDSLEYLKQINRLPPEFSQK